MTAQFKLPPLSKLLYFWMEMGEFYFYKKFLSESRKSFGVNNTNQGSKGPHIVINGVINKLVAFLGLHLILIRCLFAQKRRVVVLNHSVRKRVTKKGVRALYLPIDNFSLELMTILEDKPNNFVYPKGTLKINIESLSQSAGLFSFLLSYWCVWKYGVKDRDIVEFIVRFRLWILLLKMLKPKRVAVFVWYGKEPLIAACKQLGIEVLDLQHGIIYEEHPIYNILDGKNVIGSDFLLPDKCLVYGEYWRQHLLKSGWDTGKVRVVGYFLDVIPAFDKADDVPYLLYTSQPHTNQAILRHVRSIEHEIKCRGWKILIAVHPSEKSSAYDEVLSEYVKISNLDAYDSIRNCVAHVSVSSTLLWEAIIFEKPSYVLGYGREAVGLLSDLIGLGYAKILGEGEFPEAFVLPNKSYKEFFFRTHVDKELLNGEYI